MVIMFRTLIALIVLFMCREALSFSNCQLTDDQRFVLEFSYAYGEVYGYGYTLAAIAMQESRLGDYRANIYDPSGSSYHVTLGKVLRHFGWADTRFNRNRAMQLLMNDDMFGAELAVKELQLWERVHGEGEWMRVWASYNGGTLGNRDYAKIILRNIELIKRCNWIVNID